MDDNMTTGEVSKTSASSFAANLSSPKPIFCLLVALISLILPPLGVAMALYLVAKVISKQRKKIYLLVAAAILLVSAGGAFIYWNIYSNWRYKTNYSYSYSALDNYKLSGNLPETAITFKKPTEFKESTKHVDLALATATLNHTLKDANKSNIGTINAAITYSALASAKNYPESVAKMFETKSKGYSEFEKSFKQYLAKTLPAGMDIQLGSPGVMKSSNIPNNVWLFTFVASGKLSGSSDNTIVRGGLVFAIGKKGFYNFSFSSVDSNWARNQKVFQQVLDSIKIDQ